MKKLLLVVTVLAMASFLLVGCLPTVPIAVTGVTLDQATMTLTAGGATGTLVETVVPADATVKTVTWSSSAPAVATVANGIVTPLTAGTTTITVTTVDGSLTATCEVTVEAPVIPVAPTITAIPDQEVAWDAAPWTYPVVVTAGTGTITAYSLTGEPVTMTISAAGLITWTNIAPTPAVFAVTVRVDASDGEYDTETFVITVVEPEPVVIDIDIPDAYIDPDKGPMVAEDCYEIVVTFSDNSTTVGEQVWVRWVDAAYVSDCFGEWTELVGNADDTEFTGEICFEGVCSECEDICIEVLVGDLCCAGVVYSETVIVDSEPPVIDLNITFEDCPICDDPGAYFTFEPDTTGEFCDPEPCCEDECSGIASWAIEDTAACDACPTVSGIECPEGTFACGCLLYADEGTIDYEFEFTFTDNVGNAFVDTWTITVDTDSVVGFTSVVMAGDVPLVEGVYELYDNCPPVPELAN